MPDPAPIHPLQETTQVQSAPVGASASLNTNETRSVSGMPEKVQSLENVVYLMLTVMFVCVFLMFTGMATIMYDAWTHKAESYGELEKEVHDQNSKIDTITTGLQKYKILP